MRFIDQSPDGKIRRSSVELLEKAARWPMTAEMRAQVLVDLDTGMAIALAGKDARAIASLAKVRVAMEAQNQADDHLATKYDRIDEGKATDNIGEPMRLTFDD